MSKPKFKLYIPMWDQLNNSQRIVLPLIPSCIQTETVSIPVDMAKDMMNSQAFWLTWCTRQISRHLHLSLNDVVGFKSFLARAKNQTTSKYFITVPGHSWDWSRAHWNKWKSVQRLQWDSDQASNSTQAFLARLNYGSPGSPGKPRHELQRERVRHSFSSNCRPNQEQTLFT